MNKVKFYYDPSITKDKLPLIQITIESEDGKIIDTEYASYEDNHFQICVLTDDKKNIIRSGGSSRFINIIDLLKAYDDHKFSHNDMKQILKGQFLIAVMDFIYISNTLKGITDISIDQSGRFFDNDESIETYIQDLTEYIYLTNI